MFEGNAGAAAALGTLAGSPAWSQKISGDARILCGFPPGGTADLLCRILADAVKSEIGQNVIVDTKSGASGFIANETVATAPPDGRTVGLAAMAAQRHLRVLGIFARLADQGRPHYLRFIPQTLAWLRHNLDTGLLPGLADWVAANLGAAAAPKLQAGGR